MELFKVVFHLHSIISCFPSDVEESKGKSKKSWVFVNIMYISMYVTNTKYARQTHSWQPRS